MKRKVFSLLIAVLGLFIAIAPFTVLQPCVMMEGAACNFLAKTALLIGIIITVIGIGGVFASDKKTSIIVGFIALAAGIVEALTPTVIGACDMPDMACRVKTVPGIYVASIAVIVFSLVLIVTELFSGRSGEDVR